MVRLDDLGLFVRAAALGSFSAAAREADLLPGQVSAAIKRLERELDIRLFARSTRSLRLTAEGEQYLPCARRALESLDQGRELLRSSDDALKGLLQISAPSDLGRNVLLPWLNDFRRAHPGLSLRVLLSDQLSDVFRDPVDIAIRYGRMEDASFVALPLAPWNRRVLAASPEYLARCGGLQRPEDLQHHECLVYLIAGRPYDRWAVGSQTVRVQGGLSSDDADLIHRWGLAGEGILYKSWLDVAEDIRSGRLVQLFADQDGEATPLNLVCPHRRQFSPAVRALHTWLVERLQALQ